MFAGILSRNFSDFLGVLVNLVLIYWHLPRFQVRWILLVCLFVKLMSALYIFKTCKSSVWMNHFRSKVRSCFCFTHVLHFFRTLSTKYTRCLLLQLRWWNILVLFIGFLAHKDGVIFTVCGTCYFWHRSRDYISSSYFASSFSLLFISFPSFISQ